MKRIILFAIVMFVMASAVTLAQDKPKYKTVQCIVDRVPDGDNLGCIAVVGCNPERFNFRILAIDAPESRTGQPWGLEAKNQLRRDALNRQVTLELRGWDSRWQRHTVRVYSEGKDIGYEQVRSGLAWHFPMYARTLTADEKARYQAAMDKAKAEKLGLWSDAKPIKPADWRKGVR